MDASQEHVEEDSKYAFLLGSALREQDTEQLFQIYDNLIPKHITSERLNDIKEGARQISELCEHEFNSLVLNARTFSLASARSTMSQNGGGGRSVVPPLDLGGAGGTEEGEVLRTKTCTFSGGGSGDHHREPQVQPTFGKCGQAADNSYSRSKFDVEEDDSGLPDSLPAPSGGSFKTSVSNAASSIDEEEVDSGDERGVFDYTRAQRKTHHVRIRQSYNPPFDEEVKVCSSTGGSSVESPRSENSVTHDEYSLTNSFGEDVEGTEMTTLYQEDRQYRTSREDDDRVVSEHKYLYNKHHDSSKHSGTFWDYTGSSRGSNGKHSDNDMDDDDRYSSRAQSRGYRPPLFASSRPTTQFDHRISMGLDKPPEQSVVYSYTRNMYSDNKSLSDFGSEAGSGRREKKKNRSNGADEGEKGEGYLDVNGNPLDYSQMRHSLGGHKSDLALSASGNGSDLSHQNELDRKRQRKQRRLEKQQQFTKASRDTIKDFKGDQSVTDLIAFIEGQGRKKQPAVNQPDNGAKSGKKKQKILNGPQSPEIKVTSLKKDVLTVTSKESPSVNGKPKPASMGNQAVRGAGEDHSSGSPGSEVIPTTTEEEESKSQQTEFYDCLNSLADDVSRSDSSRTKKDNQLNKTMNKKSENVTSKSNGEVSKPSPVSNNKKVQKNKNKKDKVDNSSDSAGTVKTKKESVSKSMSFENNIIDFQEEAYEFGLHIRKEESFTEVKKKKKRTVPKEESINDSAPTTNYKPFNFNTSAYHARGNTARNNQRPRANSPPPSFETKPEEQTLKLVQQSTPMTRDLSPSAFPVLAGHSPGGLRSEGRRTSCGDISADIPDNRVLYDSDRESVKSLPAAPGTKPVAENSVYPISYARMAAATKVGYENTTSPSSESGVVSGSQNSSVGSSIITTPGSSTEIPCPLSPSDPVVGTPERKTTVWKGSPRERRHSIGSSPEDMIEVEKSTLSQRNRQKSGSQEILTRDDIAAPEATTSPPVKNILNDEKDEVSVEVEVEPSEDTSPDTSQTVLSPIKLVKEKSSLDAPQSQSPMHSPSATTSTSAGVKDVKENPQLSPKTDSLDAAGLEAKKSGAANRSSKPVVFQDKRFDTRPKQNLGITFGFDALESCPSVCSDPASQASPGAGSKPNADAGDLINKQSPATASSRSSQSSSGKSQSSPASPHSHIPPSSSRQSPSTPQTSSPSSQKSDNKKSENKVPKGPHIHSSPCNGIIVPSSVVEDSSSQKAFVVSNSNLSSNSKLSNHNSINGVSNGPGSDPQTGKQCATSPALVSAAGSAQLPTVPLSGQPCVVVPPVLSVIGSGGAIYSPNHPPPPLPGQRCDQMYNSPSTPSLPSTKAKAVSTENVVKPSNKTGKKTDATSPAHKSVSEVKSQAGVEATASPSCELTAALPVYYGMKIKTGGCGMLIFRPPTVQKDFGKDSRNSQEVSGFLRKKWKEVSSEKSPAFVTVAEK